MDKQANCHYVTTDALVRHIHSAFSPQPKQSEQGIIDGYCSYDCLVIDEMGIQRQTDSSLSALSTVICARYDHIKPTIIISNWPVNGSKTNPGLREMLGQRIIDRLLHGDSKVLVFDWNSYRGQK